ncbi:hypothetical protein HIM_09343 [Hirsutella minnesotensis 3608]|uniref:NAD dependent epimerase/dehydratase n=1 Tax=Hirsutella minnesotensis 3608 TaxID=1043627 RepID=A0A0F7ZLM8_9HYPO|nr:hypothetical protein HIM_09343 [Hirsutella minnesotensis 3608]
MGCVPSVPTDPSRTVEVIAAGFSRTGTSSMSIALARLLDGPFMHGGSQVLGREDAYVRLLIEVMRSRHHRPALLKLLRQATAGFVGVADCPLAVCFLPELLELYPDARVVLVTRDPDRWWTSMQLFYDSLPRVRGYRGLGLLLLPCPRWRWVPAATDHVFTILEERFGVEPSKDLILRYNDWVRAVTPPDRLLEMEITQGWAPLAKFLGRPVPDEPFPRVNDAANWRAIERRIFIDVALVWVSILLGVGTAGLAIWRWRQW